MKTCKIFAVILAVIFSITAVMPVFAVTEDEQFVLISGDANRDNKVNTTDAVTVLRYSAGMVKLDFYGYIAADLNGDNALNTSDASYILKGIVSDTDMFSPIEKIGDVNSPVFYTDIDYQTITDYSTSSIMLCEYTANAVEAPKTSVAFGQGYSFNLQEGKHYVFETRSLGEDNIDTVMYLLDNAGNIFLTDDNSGDGLYSRIEFYVWESNEYRLLVKGKDISDVGTCELCFGEHIYLDPVPTEVPTDAPTDKPTDIPSEIPTEAPTETPTAAPTETPTDEPIVPVDGVSFINQSLPTNGQVIQYKSAYTLRGTVHSEEAITQVRVDILNGDGDVEMSAKRDISISLNLKRYSLTDGGETSIDGRLLFAMLSIGEKRIKLYCTTQGEESLLFSGTFYVGATDELLEGNAFAGSAVLSSNVRQGILDYINGLDEEALTTKVIMEAFTDLGVPYGTGSGELDCSSYVQKAYSKVGISLPRTAAEQARYCYEKNGSVATDDRRAGDLVFFRATDCDCGRYREIHHVALYVGKIDGVRYFMEASSGKHRIVLRRAWGSNGDTEGWDIEFYSRPY